MQAVSQSMVEVREEMSISVQSDLDAAVAKSHLDDFGMCPGADGESDGGSAMGGDDMSAWCRTCSVRPVRPCVSVHADRERAERHQGDESSSDEPEGDVWATRHRAEGSVWDLL